MFKKKGQKRKLEEELGLVPNGQKAKKAEEVLPEVEEFPPKDAKGRKYTVSVAVPGSVVESGQTAELKTYLVSQLGRAFALFNIDEVIVYNDSHKKVQDTTEGVFEGANKDDPNVFLARVLQYLETPPYLRKALFPVHRDLKFAGLLASLDSPHHVRMDEESPYREGIVHGRTGKANGSYVNCGLRKEVKIDRPVKNGIRVTVQLAGIPSKDSKFVAGRVVSPKAPRETLGLYWGYEVRLAPTISKVFKECPYPEGYDLKIGVSNNGEPIEEAATKIKPFKHALIVLGGNTGIETAVEIDQELDCAIEDTASLFDLYTNPCPNRGSRTLRTEESLLVSLSALRPSLLAKGLEN
ncbi:DUF171-domain-containing protein [Basidiobolus meristosporus CBS 931.73]|uniref:DUF171-domain-containing protein n=1 Tax=Basidiobolus meristosporus CBS 931.73 TaxID=1314790 RepID=A0A1Y1XP74_9FUNG|nr:DUF171-domain-containing protein [Basidiobolus meristosporus CBS 931.73]|eukprot:ORX87540.1 DUF171-domain-containing protein [Basidiobolus meristosporus CBS 931.73]